MAKAKNNLLRDSKGRYLSKQVSELIQQINYLKEPADYKGFLQKYETKSPANLKRSIAALKQREAAKFSPVFTSKEKIKEFDEVLENTKRFYGDKITPENLRELGNKFFKGELKADDLTPFETEKIPLFKLGEQMQLHYESNTDALLFIKKIGSTEYEKFDDPLSFLVEIGAQVSTFWRAIKKRMKKEGEYFPFIDYLSIKKSGFNKYNAVYIDFNTVYTESMSEKQVKRITKNYVKKQTNK